ncbi:transcriptional regulator GcvA [Salipiger mucosus]|uniref:Glycine cleavage system transcriptional activator GcvA n=1 Tax=Salipiger mucosus DSM 16094 TaxID=1123237 RepID=S9RED0_9RHOB|nr:transcriptional regulator GcvA [Salipiger mucosus]EPX76485.1 Glycine cleavage system transcriptional activator GcvA [Salipiger mucosus DSM 16094]
MGRNLPPLAALRAFEAAARHTSFKDAAQELHVTPAAVSQQVRALEDYFQVRLFLRTPNALRLTAAGRRALPKLTSGFDDLCDASALLTDQARAAPLTISVAPSFASSWLVPRLGSFQKAKPEIQIRVDATERRVRFEAEDVDLAIRYGRGDDPGLVSECLISSAVVAVCSPEMVHADPPLRYPTELRAHTLLHQQEIGAEQVENAWAMWLSATGVDGVDATKGPRFSTHTLVLAAATAGQGVALIDRSLVEAELARGNLVLPFADVDALATPFRYFLVYPEGSGKDRRLLAFREWLFAELDRYLEGGG